MREAVAIFLILLVVAGLVLAWRRSATARRREGHSIRYRLVPPPADKKGP